MGEPGIWAPENTFEPDADEEKESLQYNWFATHFDFLKTIDIQFVAGRDLDSSRGADSTAFLINETAAFWCLDLTTLSDKNCDLN
jgi:hypothetical protein